MKNLKYLLLATQIWKPYSNISLGSQNIISVFNVYHFNILTFVHSNCVAANILSNCGENLGINTWHSLNTNMKILKCHASALEMWKPNSNITVGTKKIIEILNSYQVNVIIFCQFSVYCSNQLNMFPVFRLKSWIQLLTFSWIGMKILKYLLSAIQIWKPNSNISLRS